MFIILTLVCFQVSSIYAECPGIEWVNVDNSTDTTNFFVGGVEGLYNLYHCRFYLGKNIFAGKAKLTYGFHSCWAPVNGKEVERFENFEILSNLGATHLQYTTIISCKSTPNNAVIVGYHSNGRAIHLSRGLIYKLQTLGNIDDGYCHLPHKGREMLPEKCEILTCGVSSLTGNFNKEYLGVGFSPYTKEWTGKTTPPWNSYGINDVKNALALVSTKFRSITTYSMGVNQWNVDHPWYQADSNCLVARAAAQINKQRNRLDLKVNIGAYQNNNAKIMQKEISAAFDAATDANVIFRSTVWGITFTNEYILNESQGYKVLEIIRQNNNKAKSKGLKIGTRTQMCHQILTRSSPLYNVLTQIAAQSDFIMCNMYPEERAVHGPIENAVKAIGSAYSAYASAFKKINPRLNVIIGETGWPSEGKSFNKSPNSVANLAKFWYSMASWASNNRVLVQMFEGIDEPWKSNRNNLDPNSPGGINGAEGHYGWWKRQGNRYIQKDSKVAQNTWTTVNCITSFAYW